MRHGYHAHQHRRNQGKRSGNGGGGEVAFLAKYRRIDGGGKRYAQPANRDKETHPGFAISFGERVLDPFRHEVTVYSGVLSSGTSPRRRQRSQATTITIAATSRMAASTRFIRCIKKPHWLPKK